MPRRARVSRRTPSRLSLTRSGAARGSRRWTSVPDDSDSHSRPRTAACLLPVNSLGCLARQPGAAQSAGRAALQGPWEGCRALLGLRFLTCGKAGLCCRRAHAWLLAPAPLTCRPPSPHQPQAWPSADPGRLSGALEGALGREGAEPPTAAVPGSTRPEAGLPPSPWASFQRVPFSRSKSS